jgi:hypothetical protein
VLAFSPTVILVELVFAALGASQRTVQRALTACGSG